VGALVMTSLLAGSATAAFGLYHFGRLQLYFVLANLVAVPLTGLWVMPWGLVALALMPMGWEFLALAPMSWGLGQILWVAHAVAGLPGAAFDLPFMPLWGLLACTGGLLWLGLWRGWWRLFGVVPLLLGFVSPALHRPVDVLVSTDARAIMLRAGEGVYLRPEGSVSRFVLDGLAGYWAAGEPRRLPVDVTKLITCVDHACRVRPRAGTSEALVLMKGESLPPGSCDRAAIILAAVTLENPCPGIPHIDRFTVWRDGAHAVWLDTAGARIVSDRMVRGDRPWVAIPPRRRPELPPAKTE